VNHEYFVNCVITFVHHDSLGWCRLHVGGLGSGIRYSYNFQLVSIGEAVVHDAPANFDSGHLCYLIRVGNDNAVQLVPEGAKCDTVVEKVDDDKEYGVVTDGLKKMKRSTR